MSEGYDYDTYEESAYGEEAPAVEATADTNHIDLAWTATEGPYLIERRVV